MYIARNSNGCLFLYEQKPTRVRTGADKGYWTSNGVKMPMSGKMTHPRWQDEPIPVRLESDWINETLKE